jgi:hypothetical protein
MLARAYVRSIPNSMMEDAMSDNDLRDMRLTVCMKPAEADAVERAAKHIDRSMSWLLRQGALRYLRELDARPAPRRARV